MAFGFEFRDENGNLMFQPGRRRFSVYGLRESVRGYTGSMPVSGFTSLSNVVVTAHYSYDYRPPGELNRKKYEAFTYSRGEVVFTYPNRITTLSLSGGKLHWSISRSRFESNFSVINILIMEGM